MLAELARFAAGWPLALSLARRRHRPGAARRAAADGAERGAARAAPAAAGAGPGRCRRTPGRGGAELSRQAAAALERLEREINGEARAPAARSRWRLAPLLAAAVAPLGRAGGAGRRAAVAALGGAAGQRRAATAASSTRALDNLIVNALEHGGARVERRRRGERRAGAAADRGPRLRPGAGARRARSPGASRCGLAASPARSRGSAGGAAAATGCGWCGGSPPRTAASFAAARARRGRTEAVLELPLAGAGERA